jgi:transcriptional regulator NrdR family protein
MALTTAMQCPMCKSKDLSVLSTDLPKRRRMCNQCGYRWNTVETRELELSDDILQAIAILAFHFRKML